MTFKHTPGPWKVTGVYNHIIDSGNDDYDIRTIVAEAWRVNHQDDYEANARLIAAAPDMLEALIEIFDENLKLTIEEQRNKMIKIIEAATGMSIKEVLAK